ncbi:MAG: TMEM165/GDT1 family protein [Dehalococcoidia bacterium]
MDLQASFAAFSLLFVMEMGDKTQLAVLSLTAKTGRPMPVFFGALLGLAAVTLIGVTLGTAIVAFVPGDWVGWAAAIGFIVMGAVILLTALRNGGQGDGEEEIEHAPKSRSALGIAAGTSVLLFVAELGDKSQLAVIGLTAQLQSPAAVFIGGVTALTLVTLAGVVLGKMVTRVVPVRWLSIGSGIMFIVIGALTLAGIF